MLSFVRASDAERDKALARVVIGRLQAWLPRVQLRRQRVEVPSLHVPDVEEQPVPIGRAPTAGTVEVRHGDRVHVGRVAYRLFVR